jgi:protein-L-isoaspartate(D-aspartate) O-methyltransferase
MVLMAAFWLSGMTLLRCAPAGEAPRSRSASEAESAYARRRQELVDREIAPEINDRRVLDAMRRVPRHLFVPEELREFAYENRPLPIGEDQTISQPFVVALMTQLLRLDKHSRVLEIGTGSGYQAAVLAELTPEVYTIEILEPLARHAAATLAELGYDKVRVRTGDGYRGWPEAAPFDGILVTCAPEQVPAPLQEQLAEGGRMVIPVGAAGNQELLLIEKEGGQLVRRAVIPVRFVPMTGPGVSGGRAADTTAAPGLSPRDPQG